MYKSKLQEYCQSKAWNLPEYSTTKEGLDHCPQFKATVNVNGSTFTTPALCKSSKEAQNLAAKLAFNHLTLSGSLSTTSASPVTPTSIDIQQPQTNEKVHAASLSGMNCTNRDDKKHKDMAHLYKNQLQIYAQKRNLALPVYLSERDGPPHACRFKSKVMLEGNAYESLEYFSTLKDAENAAAKLALSAVSSDAIVEEDPGFFKNLLQELAQKEYSCLPAYNTTWSGASHMPKFISIVEINKEAFWGQEAKSKKLAEMNAAKVAYTALKERADQKAAESECEPEVSTNAAENVCRHELPYSVSAPVQSPSQLCLSVQPELSAGSGASSLPHKRVKVYPRTTNMTFPPGTIIMRSDDKWVAVTNMDSIHGNA